jgi:hypothetical protein
MSFCDETNIKIMKRRLKKEKGRLKELEHGEIGEAPNT